MNTGQGLISTKKKEPERMKNICVPALIFADIKPCPVFIDHRQMTVVPMDKHNPVCMQNERTHVSRQ